jgi:hypothetical protein
MVVLAAIMTLLVQSQFFLSHSICNQYHFRLSELVIQWQLSQHLQNFLQKVKQKYLLNTSCELRRHIIFWSIPITVLFIVLRAQIVRTILRNRSNLVGEDTRLVSAAALALFVDFSSRTKFDTTFCARLLLNRRDNKTFNVLQLISIVASTICISVWFISFLYESSP